ncbi:MAG TPA: neutral/alkaline non-lysosomal ceramidase N-terminal domain-containing protein, partial [Vulgatibacter sp.]
MPRAPSKSRIRARRALLVSAAVAGCLVLAGTVDLRAPREERPPRILSVASGAGTLLAGAGRVRVDLPEDVVLAGYRPFGRSATREMSTGLPDGPPEIAARSLVLEVAGLRTAIVSVELMTLPPSLASRIDERLRAEGVGCSIVAATHTHSGPGGYDRAKIPQAVAVGVFDPAVEQAILDGVSASLVSAKADLGPAELAMAEAEVVGATNRDRRGAPLDDRLT